MQWEELFREVRGKNETQAILLTLYLIIVPVDILQWTGVGFEHQKLVK